MRGGEERDEGGRGEGGGRRREQDPKSYWYFTVCGNVFSYCADSPVSPSLG